MNHEPHEPHERKRKRGNERNHPSSFLPYFLRSGRRIQGESDPSKHKFVVFVRFVVKILLLLWSSANANLASLTVSAGNLNPAFSPATTDYTVLVPNNVASITVSAAVADTGKATLVQSPPNPAPLNAPSTTITLGVTAEDRTTTKTYTLRVNKTTETNALVITINAEDERIDLTRTHENDLSRSRGDTLRIRAPAGYDYYIWRMDIHSTNYNTITEREIEIDASRLGELGTHSLLLKYGFDEDTMPYGCEALFMVVR
jgi:hypothetical protein